MISDTETNWLLSSWPHYTDIRLPQLKILSNTVWNRISYRERLHAPHQCCQPTDYEHFWFSCNLWLLTTCALWMFALLPPLKEWSNVFTSVCLYVCLSVSVLDYSRTYGFWWILGREGRGTKTKWLDFGGDSNHHPNPEIFKSIYIKYSRL